MRKTLVRSSLVLLLTLAASGLAACGSDDSTEVGAEGGEGTVTVADAWSRRPVPGQTTSAAYAVVSNSGDADVTIVSATSPVTDRVELHETTMDADGVMSMAEVPEGFVVPAGGSFTFEPGGPHFMFLDIDPAAYPEDSVAVTMTLDSGESIEIDAEVRSAAPMADMDHSEMEDADS